MNHTPDTSSTSVSSMQDPMRMALVLAQHAIGLSEPNPRVGCVITTASGRVIGQGYTQQAGSSHAEVMALHDVVLHNESAVGATAYVTLEPCAHQGRTPPCCDALINAGIAKVVMAMQDPNPLVAGRGQARLRAAGMQVICLERNAETETVISAAHELNIGFFSRMQRGIPWVRLKAAVSLDGRTALNNGASTWITGLAARTDGHAWRRRAGAVLTGVGTVRQDNPRLDVRLVDTAVQPLRVILDSHLETPADARILNPPGKVLIYTTTTDPQRSAALQARGAEVVVMPSANDSLAAKSEATHKVNLQGVLTHLAERGINELHIEAGHRLNGSLVQAGLVDEFLIYMAPSLIGLGRELATFGPLQDLQQRHLLRFFGITTVGDDLRIVARPAASAEFLKRDVNVKFLR
jgi:diaminohydroxyphosphoribosylaminopyrimidine deaminase / 5-amino-6-(5-phosphoribosylamino)uracil reductase